MLGILDLFRRKPKSAFELLMSSPGFRRQRDRYNELSKLCEDGIDADEFPNASGEFGLYPGNPIPCKTIFGSTSYLSRLRAPDGSKVSYSRLGSKKTNVSPLPIDVYEISHADESKMGAIYISPYQKRVSGRAPRGFILVDGIDNQITPEMYRKASVEFAWGSVFPIVSEDGLGMLELCKVTIGWPGGGDDMVVLTLRLITFVRDVATGEKTVGDIYEQDVLVGRVPLPSGPCIFNRLYKVAINDFEQTAKERLTTRDLKASTPHDFCSMRYTGPQSPWIELKY